MIPTDTNNPTGYAHPIEAWTVAPAKRTSSTKPATTCIIGNTVLAQTDDAGNVTWLLTDGHRSTIVLANSSATITTTFFYDAFAGAIGNLNPAPVRTIFLFGGDAVYDPISGLDMNGNGTRDRLGFEFIQADTPGNGSSVVPISLHRYLYAGANPVTKYDPTGHDGLADLLLSMGI